MRGVALVSAIGLTMGLAACSSSDSGSGDASGSAPPAASGSLLIWADERRAQPIQELATSWGEENGVTVTVTQINFDDLKDQYTQQAPSGQGPDVLLGANDWSGEWVANGLVAPINLGDNRSNFNPASVDAFTIDGQTYGVPVATENIIMFRNTELAPDSPATINEMAATGLKLQEDGKTQFPIGVQVGDKGDAYHAYPFFSAAGGYFFGGPDANGTYDINDVGVASDGGLVFAKAWSDFGKQGVVKSTFTGGDLEAAWAAGKLPYWITGPWNKGKVEESGVKFVAEPVPGWEGVDKRPVPIVGAQGFYLNQFSNNKTTAQAFLDATMNTQFMDSLYNADPRPPAWIESANAASSDPVIAAILKFGDGGYPNLPYPQMGIVYEESGLAQKKILDGADPVATTEEAQKNIEARIGGQ
jgi:arabinogalactan oligomer/maltooligosaccharide transport system substrate-binding protein